MICTTWSSRKNHRHQNCLIKKQRQIQKKAVVLQEVDANAFEVLLQFIYTMLCILRFFLLKEGDATIGGYHDVLFENTRTHHSHTCTIVRTIKHY